MNTTNTTNTTVKAMMIAAAIALAAPTASLMAQQNSGTDDTGQVVIQGQQQPTKTPDQMEQADGMNADMQVEPMSPEQTKAMVKDLFMAQASGNQFEIESSQYLIDNSDNEGVKGTAHAIITDHTKALKILREQGEKAGVTIPEKPELNAVNKAELALLKKETGKELNEAYIYAQDGAHLLVSLILTHAEQGQSPEFATYASDVLGSVKGHHAMLHEQANSLSGYGESAAMTAGGQMNDMQQQNDQMDGKARQMEVAKFFKKAAQANEYEIRTAKMAVEKSNNPRVKQIAQTVIDDHEKALKLLRDQAEAANVDVREETQLNDVFSAKVDMLQKKDGAAFDRAYIFDAAAGHRISLLTEADAKRELGQSKPLVQYLEKASKDQEKHFEAVKPVASDLSGGYDFTEVERGGGAMNGTNNMNGDMKAKKPANPMNDKDADSTGSAANGPEEDDGGM